MKFTILYENTKKDEKLLAGHGLSIYIEAFDKKILLDTGQDGSFLENAKYLGVDIKSIDYAVISHFHYDHAGGLVRFLDENKKAKIYVSNKFFKQYYTNNQGKMIYYGLNEENYDVDRFIFVDDKLDISDNIKIISNLNYKFNNPLNEKFHKKINKQYTKDDFSHEIALLINENNKSAMFSGCFHSGIINSIEKAKNIGEYTTHLIGGFHLEGSSGKVVSKEYISKLGEYLDENNIIGYTGHCSGINSFKKLKDINENSIHYIYTGSEYKI